MTAKGQLYIKELKGIESRAYHKNHDTGILNTNGKTTLKKSNQKIGSVPKPKKLQKIICRV